MGNRRTTHNAMKNVIAKEQGATETLPNAGVTSIVDQIRMLAFRENRLAFLIGSAIGSFVPVAVFALNSHVMGGHHSLLKAWGEGGETRALLGLILAGAVFSAKSVFGWGLSAFAGDKLKAFGYCALIEGVMVLSPLEWLRWLAMIYLIGINMIATGANLMEVRETPTEEERELSELIRELESGKSKAEVARARKTTVRTVNRRLERARQLNLPQSFACQ